MEQLFNVRKYFDYFFETKGFTSLDEPPKVGDQVQRAALFARDKGRNPAIFIQGIMPRSGTVYVGELLRLHPSIYAYPNQIWEFPALTLTNDLNNLQKKFLVSYRFNQDKFEDNDFVTLFGAALMAYLHQSVPPHQRLLIKMPSVQYLNYFPAMFPYENLLILLRDGRDLVHSTLRTWRQLNFVQVCLRWNRSARIILTTIKQLEACGGTSYCLAKYEDALQKPEVFISEVCRRFDLDESHYPYERIQAIRVIGSSKLEKKGKVRWRHLDRPKDFKPLEYWKDWSLLRKVIFKAIAGKSLIELGYSRDINW
jgi:protein-tyrosine sulfotransferase